MYYIIGIEAVEHYKNNGLTNLGIVIMQTNCFIICDKIKPDHGVEITEEDFRVLSSIFPEKTKNLE